MKNKGDVASDGAHACDLVESGNLGVDPLALLAVDLVVDADEPALQDGGAVAFCRDGSALEAVGKVLATLLAGKEVLTQDEDKSRGGFGIVVVANEDVHQSPEGGAPVLWIHFLLGKEM